MRYMVVTPENVELSFELAGPAVRFVAWVIDFVFMIAAFVAVAICVSVMGVFAPYAAYTIMIIAWFIIQQGYFVFFELKTGGCTPGKRIMKSRVIQDNGVKITFYNSFLMIN